jgi:hypothetical protein
MIVVVTISSKTPAVFVLSQINSRFFRDLESYCLLYSLDFSVVKDGESKPFARSTQAMPSCRRVTLEADLEPGKYHVYVSGEQRRLAEGVVLKSCGRLDLKGRSGSGLGAGTVNPNLTNEIRNWCVAWSSLHCTTCQRWHAILICLFSPG